MHAFDVSWILRCDNVGAEAEAQRGSSSHAAFSVDDSSYTMTQIRSLPVSSSM